MEWFSILVRIHRVIHYIYNYVIVSGNFKPIYGCCCQTGENADSQGLSEPVGSCQQEMNPLLFVFCCSLFVFDVFTSTLLTSFCFLSIKDLFFMTTNLKFLVVTDLSHGNVFPRIIKRNQSSRHELTVLDQHATYLLNCKCYCFVNFLLLCASSVLRISHFLQKSSS